MKISKAVRIVALINLVFPVIVWAEWKMGPDFECGDYLVKGKLTRNQLGDFVIKLRPRSNSPVELIVLGGDPEQKIENLDTEVALEINIPKPIKSNNQPFVILRKFINKDTLKTDSQKVPGSESGSRCVI